MTPNPAIAAINELTALYSKEPLISLRILTLVGRGMDAVEAMRIVLGADVTDQFIDDLYTQLRAKGGR